MRRLRLNKRTYLAWGRWWAVQLVIGEVGGFGIRPVLTRPLLDLYLGPLTVSVGNNPIWTDRATYGHRVSCRGFLVLDEPVF